MHNTDGKQVDLVVHFGWARRPQRRRVWWSGVFIINYDGYGIAPCITCPSSCPRPTQPHSTPPYPTTCTITSPITPINTDTITNTIPGNANTTSTFYLMRDFRSAKTGSQFMRRIIFTPLQKWPVLTQA